MDDRIIDFNELKNRVNDKDIDKFEGYMYSLYSEMSTGKINMAEFSKKIQSYMEENNISQEKFMKIQTKLMERYGFSSKDLEEQLKNLGVDNMMVPSADMEKARKAISFAEKYKDRIKIKTVNEYYIKNEKNNVNVLTEGINVILTSEIKIDLTDVELNEFLCSYKKVVDNQKLKITLCEMVSEYDY